MVRSEGGGRGVDDGRGWVGVGMGSDMVSATWWWALKWTLFLGESPQCPLSSGPAYQNKSLLGKNTGS